MSWRETIKPGNSEHAGEASFRGVWFKTTDAEIQGGRRTVLHEYPDRDRPYPEDMGKRAKEFRVEGYVIGDDYLDQRDALLKALEAGGPGELRHPRYGVLQVSVIGIVSVKESNREGGLARFSLTFVDAGDNVFPGARDDTVAEVDDAATACEDEAQDLYAQTMNLAGPSWVLQDAINAANSTVKGLLSTVQQVTSLEGLSALVGSVVSLTGNVAGLIRTPVVFAQSLRSIFNQLVQGVRRPLAALQELQAVFGDHTRPSDSARAGSPTARTIANRAAHDDLVRTLAIAAQARMVAVAISASVNDVGAQLLEDAPVATATQALALRDAVLGQIDTELETNEPEPSLAAALQRLRAAVARDVTERAELLGERGAFTPATVLPALALAHRIYQDAGRVDELVARNNLRNPNFVPALPLEVLQ